VDFGGYPLTVQAIGPMMTTFVTSFGETVQAANHLLAQKMLINHTRSPNPFLRVTISLATRTEPFEISKLSEALKQYVRDNRGDWHVAYLFFSAVKHEKGEIVLDAWMGCANSYHDWASVYGAKSRVHVWLHAYIYEAGLHFVKPTQPFAGADAGPLRLQKADAALDSNQASQNPLHV
jgi:small-conductance mechanosensitive channel